MALVLCGVFTLVGILRWFSVQVGSSTEVPGIYKRLQQGVLAVVRGLSCRQILPLMGIFVTRVLFQAHIFKQSPTRWVAHIFISYGILMLIGFHALDDVTSSFWFSDYQPTLNPFRLLRELLGVLALSGIAIALYRRIVQPCIRHISNLADIMLLGLLAVILVSGFALESIQMASESVFDEMVADYLDEDDPDELAPLKAFWADSYGVVFSDHPVSADPDVIKSGAQLHMESCAECHAPAGYAFVAYPTTRLLRPWAAWLNAVRADLWLYYFHYLISLLALGFLPFSKLFHLLATPLSLLVQSAGHPATHSPANRFTRRAMSFSACTRCGECSRLCSVAPVYDVIQNKTILPTEKLTALSTLKSSFKISQTRVLSFSEGSFVCTECYRCTEICPSGIHLQDLWQASKRQLAAAGQGPLYHRVREHSAIEWHDMLKTGAPAMTAPNFTHLADDPDTFRFCVQCSVCTNVCPVVAASSNPALELDLTPQQIMNMLRLNLKEMTYGARMVWDCVTCYMCQEHCPQHIRVADILYELRNSACYHLPGVSTADGDVSPSQDGARSKKDRDK